MITIVQCAFCTHYLAGQQRCTAFPAGIPKAILDGESDHRLPYPGDHGIRLELVPDVPKDFLGPLPAPVLEKAS